MHDVDAINRYNAGNRDLHFRLQTHLGPCLAEGDPETCSILILLGNPVFHPQSKPGDHTLFYEGWPLAGIHPNAPEWLKKWWRPRLRYVALAVEDDWQWVSKRIAAINLNPWASERFDEDCVLPSRAGQLERAREAAKRGTVVIVVRARKIWMPALSERDVLLTRSPRCSYISPKNLGSSAWKRIEDAIRSGFRRSDF
jgi:hypothetical protein